jgi:hypothetical protein
MSWRKSGSFRAPEEILVLTCDVCACDIGHENERRPRRYFKITEHPNPGAMDEQEPFVAVCSRQCLQAFASKVEGHDRAPPLDTGPPRGER